MENIYLHIENLLVHNEFVVVPGLGGFILQYNPAVLEGTVLKAPQKVIAFNSLMHHADGLLAVEYSRFMQVSFREAQLFVDNAVTRIKLELQLSGRCEFGNLGLLQLDKDGILSFEPNLSANFIPDNFYKSDIWINQKPSVEFKSNTQRHFELFKVMRYAAMLALVVGVQLVSTKLSDNRSYNSASIVNVNTFAQKQLDKNSKTTTSIQITDSSSIDTLVVEKPRIEINSLDDDSLYHVVVASLGTIDAAESFKKELEKRSEASVRILKPSSLYRVAIKSFENYDDAIHYMEKLRVQDEEFASAWVYCKK